ncbi:Na+/H+ antiporter subunit G [Sphingomonas montana]|uniref:Na+/H+ antiporter subunit G n=1 Tax=Sphingomonas montana TaxID=1843236 RepID=UPI00096D9E22|nr:Na+/H+ antiporter subunit G [Sphingomonas montana]
MNGMVDGMLAGLILLGGAFVLIGSWGLVRLPTTMERLHGPTKATTLGLGSLLLASVGYALARHGIWSAHELLIALFLFITAPISANMIAKVHLHRARTDPSHEPTGIAGPPPGIGEGDWATFAGARGETEAGEVVSVVEEDDAR